MKTKALGVALGLGLAAALLAPPTAEAGHRHSRGCHGSRYSSHGYSNGYGGYGYSNGYGYSHSYRSVPSYGYYPSYRYAPPPPPPVYYGGDYSYGGGYYAPRYGYSRGPAVALHYHGGSRCSRSHVSVHLGY